MKKTLGFLAVASMIILASACSKEQNVIDNRSNELVSVTLKVSADTKSMLGSDLKSVSWTAGDQIGVLDPTSNTAQPNGFTITDNTVTVLVPAGASSFYGLYPFDAKATIASDVISTNFPSEQIAVEGNMPNNANIAVGYASSLTATSMNFMNVGALISFTLTENDNITSVVFAGNNNEDVAGPISIKYPAAGTPTVAFGTNASKTIVLKNADGTPLKKNVKYYMVVAPQTFSNGISISLVKSDGSVGTKSSSAATTIGRNKSLGAGEISGLVFGKDLYTQYQSGADVTIAGKTYNKSTSGNATLLDSDTNQDLVAQVNGKSGVFFLKGSKNFTLSSNLVIDKDIVISNNNPTNTVTFQPAASPYIGLKTGSLTFSDITFDMSSKTNYLFNNAKGATEDFSALVFDKCSFTNIKGSLLYASNNKTVGINTISVRNCKIQMSAGKPLFNAFQCSAMYKYKSIIFENNIMYSAAAVNAQVFNYVNKTTQSGTTGDCSISMKNNIFYNIYSTNSLIKHYIVTSLSSGHNIYNTTTCGTGTGSKSFAIYGKKPAGAVITNDGDILKVSDETQWSYNFSGTWNASGVTNKLTSETNDIFSSFNTTTGEYVLNAAYTSFGPQQ